MSPTRVEWLEQPGDVVALAAAELASGGVVVFPTDTVYGLLAAGDSAAGHRRIYQIKSRSFQKPLALLVAPGSAVAVEIAELLRRERRTAQLAAEFSAGSLTVVLDPADLRSLPGSIGEVQPGPVGLRCPAHPQLQQLLAAAGGCAWGTSVNLSGATAASSALEVTAWLAGLEGRAADVPPLVVLSMADGTGVASDVVDLSGPEPRRLR